MSGQKANTPELFCTCQAILPSQKLFVFLGWKTAHIPTQDDGVFLAEITDCVMDAVDDVLVQCSATGVSGILLVSSEDGQLHPVSLYHYLPGFRLFHGYLRAKQHRKKI